MCKIPTEVATLTLHRWKNRRDHTGDVKARFGYQTGYNHKISDMEEFQKFIDQNSGKTHQQLADLYPVEMSAKTMGVWIKRLGYTRKKRASDTKNVMH
ncbi:hypothetical protein [Piscirickettsia salmonis]|uniref:hypothetical protein n=1 Tax=Piscirickettsia salmonis TaxID=1238 RepID=UPI0018AD032F|nr:hypothetical protein [Piscirickettsia salmonis]